MKILMVCLGNICRSPLAEGLLRKKLEEKGIDATVDSAGTGDYHIGEAPDPRAQDNARKNGLDLTCLKARQFTVSDFDEFDKILVMDRSNLQNVLSLARTYEDRDKVDLILNYASPNENQEVPDPYFGGPDGFQHVYNLLDEACNAIISEIEAEKR